MEPLSDANAGNASDANTGHASDASAELSELETAGPWRKAFDALRASLWIRRPRPTCNSDVDKPAPLCQCPCNCC